MGAGSEVSDGAETSAIGTAVILGDDSDVVREMDGGLLARLAARSGPRLVFRS